MSLSPGLSLREVSLSESSSRYPEPSWEGCGPAAQIGALVYEKNFLFLKRATKRVGPKRSGEGREVWRNPKGSQRCLSKSTSPRLVPAAGGEGTRDSKGVGGWQGQVSRSPPTLLLSPNLMHILTNYLALIGCLIYFLFSVLFFW